MSELPVNSFFTEFAALVKVDPRLEKKLCFSPAPALKLMSLGLTEL